jgi:hypothetical protein
MQNFVEGELRDQVPRERRGDYDHRGAAGPGRNHPAEDLQLRDKGDKLSAACGHPDPSHSLIF